MSNRLMLDDLEAEYEKLMTEREDLEEELRFVKEQIFKIEQEYLKENSWKE